MRERSLNALTIALVLCAVATTGLAVRRELSGKATPPDISKPRKIERWEQYATSGHPLASAQGKLTIVVFSDFECPYCREFALNVMPHLVETFPGEVRVLFRHLPIPSHRFAILAARAAECAGEQGRFEAYHNVLFANQKLLGIKTFEEMGGEAGIPDIRRFVTCSASTSPMPTVDSDIEAAKALGISGTPGILIGGLLYNGIPPLSSLDSIIRTTLKH